MQGLPATPLTPPPAELVLAHPASKWNVVRSMLGFVFLLFLVVQVSSSLIFAGLLDGDFNGTLGPSDPILAVIGSICLLPCVAGFAFFRRPRLIHVIRAKNSIFGNTANLIEPRTVIQTSERVVVEHHLFRDNSPLQMPSGTQLWWLFFGGVFFSTVCMLPLLIMGLNLYTGALFACIVIPAFIVGFSTPVFAWWSTSNSYFGLPTTRRLAEWMLIAGMVSTLPAIILNSFVSPIILNAIGLNTTNPTSLGFGLILMLSAPIGEELCKAIAVLALARFIDSPRRGFQIGFTVGLGFALLENSGYILSTFMAGEETAVVFAFTSLLRAVGSIPGHGVWTAISGYSIGTYLSNRKRPVSLPGYGEKKDVLNDQSSHWILLDSNGQVVKQSMQAHIEDVSLPYWLCVPKEKALQLPTKPWQALLLAMTLHSFWNGTSWGLSVLLADQNTLGALLAVILWSFSLILGLWQFTRYILPNALATKTLTESLQDE